MSDDFDTARNASKGSTAPKSGPLQFLTFTVEGEEYGVDIMKVREIKGWTETTRLPNSSECVRGVMNLRGLIVPIFDLRMRFRHEPTEADAKHVIIILAVAGRNIGMLVDAVSDILTVEAEDIKPAPEIESSADEGYIGGLISLEQRMVVLLAVEHLFNHKAVRDSETAAA